MSAYKRERIVIPVERTLDETFERRYSSYMGGKVIIERDSQKRYVLVESLPWGFIFEREGS